MMTEKERAVAAQLLEMASEEFGNHGCNDWDFPKGWTKEEKIAFCKEYHEWNGDPEDFDPNFLHLPDYAVMSFMADKLKRCNNV
jgi:hypothetical protein